VELAEKSLSNLNAALGGMQLEAADVLRVSCFTSSLRDYAQVHKLVIGQFPAAAVNIVQIQRAAESQEVECEAVARLRNRLAEPLRLVNPAQAAFAQAALVSAPEIVLTTTHAALGSDDASVRAVFRQLSETLTAGGATLDTVFYSYAYPVNSASLQKYRDIRWDFFKRVRAPASTNLVFEGLPSPGQTLGIDVMALSGR
jgi:enamine deaminase RidA (YjgF/YER057c/UK114 family)